MGASEKGLLRFRGLLLLALQVLVFLLQAFDVLILAFVFIGGDEIDRSAANCADGGCGYADGSAGDFRDEATGQKRGGGENRRNNKGLLHGSAIPLWPGASAS